MTLSAMARKSVAGTEPGCVEPLGGVAATPSGLPPGRQTSELLWSRSAMVAGFSVEIGGGWLVCRRAFASALPARTWESRYGRGGDAEAQGHSATGCLNRAG